MLRKTKYKNEEEKLKARRESDRRYAQSSKGIARNKKATKKYYNSKKGLLTRTKYYNSEDIQKRIKDYRNSPIVKKKHNEAQREFGKSSKGILIEQKRKKTSKYKIRVKFYEIQRKNDPNRINWTKEYNQRPEVIKRRRELAKSEKSRIRDRAYSSKQQKTNPQFRLASNVRKRITRYLKGIRGRKYGKTNELLSCDWKYLKKHLESNFYNNKKTKEPMTWSNYGKWHVDHIMPLSSFDLIIVEEQFAACHFSNLQPLWAEDNIAKNNRLDWAMDK